MTNHELSIIMRLRDEASKRLQGLKGNLQRFANNFRQNWLGITAAVTAAFLAIKKSIELMELGAKAKQIEDSFRNMAESVGINAKKMQKSIMDASAGVVNFSNVADKASALLAQGLSMDTVTALMRQARVEARIFGSTTEEAFQNISSAVSGGLVTTLRRSYGLQLSLSAATESYAAATGKSTDEIKKNYMAQALANHILEQGKSHLEAVNLEVMSSYEKIQKMKANWLSFTEKLGQTFYLAVTFIQGMLNQLVHGIFVVMEAMTGLIQKSFSWLEKYYQALGKLPGAIGEPYRAAAKGIGKFSTSISNDLTSLKEAFKTSAEQSKQEALKQYGLVFAKVKDLGDNTAGVLKTVAKTLKDTAGEVKETFDLKVELAKQAAQNMQNAFSSFFFKAFTGELATVKEVFADFGKSILQMISQIVAKMLIMKIFTGLAGPGGKLFGLSVDKLFHSGGVVRKHSGGLIRAHNGLAPDEVPAILQTDEGVVSRRGMRTLGASNLNRLNNGQPVGGGGVVNVNPVVVIKAWDVSDIYKHKNEIQGIITESIYRNGMVRKALQGYT